MPSDAVPLCHVTSVSLTELPVTEDSGQMITETRDTGACVLHNRDSRQVEEGRGVGAEEEEGGPWVEGGGGLDIPKSIWEEKGGAS